MYLSKKRGRNQVTSWTRTASRDRGGLAVRDNAWFESEWFRGRRAQAQSRFRQSQLDSYGQPVAKRFMEVGFTLADAAVRNKTRQELYELARCAQVSDGWPIGVVLDGTSNRPKPQSDGICAEVSAGTYDYWYLRTNGDYYMLRNLKEGATVTTPLSPRIRMEEVAEVLLYCNKLYSKFELTDLARIRIVIVHGGLLNSVLQVRPIAYGPSLVDEVISGVEIAGSELSEKLWELVKALTIETFQMFDFYVPDDAVYERIVNAFAAKYGSRKMVSVLAGRATSATRGRSPASHVLGK